MNIALITEGVNDRPIIEAMLTSYFSQNIKDEILLLNPLQPKDKEPGGWTRVLTYCESDDFRNSLIFNEYVIIHIDSDKHLDKGYDVESCPTDTQLVQAIQQRIIKSIGLDFYQANSHKIIFAISINSIECWLLPFYATTNAHKSKTTNCCVTLNKYLIKFEYTLNCGNSEGSHEYYQKAAKLLSKKRGFFSSYSSNESLKYFVEAELTKIKALQIPFVVA